MNEWTRAQEADFQALIHRASEQSRECYRRRRDNPEEAAKQEQPGPNLRQEEPPKPAALPIIALPPPRAVQPSAPRSPARRDGARSDRKATAQTPRTAPTPTPAQPTKTAPKAAAGINIAGGLKALTDRLDSEGIMLAVLLWLLVEEKADSSVILAIAYILLV